jgi:hypothetical protein
MPTTTTHPRIHYLIFCFHCKCQPRKDPWSFIQTACQHQHPNNPPARALFIWLYLRIPLARRLDDQAP